MPPTFALLCHVQIISAHRVISQAISLAAGIPEAASADGADPAFARLWVQQLGEADAVQELLAHPVHDPEGDLRAVACRIDIGTKRALAGWRGDNICYRSAHGAG